MMAAPVLTFFNSKGGVGKTSLVYHLAWMLSGIGERVLVCDLDPQANLTSTFLGESELESLWEDDAQDRTIYQCVQPLTAVGDWREPRVYPVSETLGLIPGDLALSSFEENLSSEWPNALGGGGPTCTARSASSPHSGRSCRAPPRPSTRRSCSWM